jgi:NAD(P)-dependent dehydrogenase (short-subunit alcohol dehydrogenase family)
MGGKLDGKIAVVTGGNSGIGLATAKRFASEGAYVFITGRRQAELDRGAAEIGQNAVAVRADSSNLTDLDKLYGRVKMDKGRIDILFANAGGGEFAPLGEITEEHYDKTFTTNVKGLLFTVQKALPLFRNGGSIILNASTGASTGTAALSVYNATKAAVRSFARSWILDLADRHIRVNAVSPGPIATPGLDGLAETEEQARRFKAGLVTNIPLGRLGAPDEVAKAAVFLASVASSMEPNSSSTEASRRFERPPGSPGSKNS